MVYTELNKLALDAENIARERCEQIDAAFDKAMQEHDWLAIMKRAAGNGFHGMSFTFDHPYQSRYYVCKLAQMLRGLDDSFRIEISRTYNNNSIFLRKNSATNIKSYMGYCRRG